MDAKQNISSIRYFLKNVTGSVTFSQECDLYQIRSAANLHWLQ